MMETFFSNISVYFPCVLPQHICGLCMLLDLWVRLLRFKAVTFCTVCYRKHAELSFWCQVLKGLRMSSVNSSWHTCDLGILQISD